MGHALRKGISFCDVSDRLLFLDLAADRYFCLGETAERAFRSLIERRELQLEESRALACLAVSGMLVETTDDQVPNAFRAGFAPSASLIETPASRVGIHHRLAAMVTLTRTRFSLRSGSLQ